MTPEEQTAYNAFIASRFRGLPPPSHAELAVLCRNAVAAIERDWPASEAATRLQCGLMDAAGLFATGGQYPRSLRGGPARQGGNMRLVNWLHRWWHQNVRGHHISRHWASYNCDHCPERWSL